MKRLVKIAVCAAVAAALVSSCTVYEDRRECPVWLRLYLEEALASPLARQGGDILVSADGVSVPLRIEDAVNLENVMEGFKWESAVRRGGYDALAVSAGSGFMRDDLALLVPAGQSCDSLYAWSERLSCTEEWTEADVALHKRFITLSVCIRDRGEAAGTVSPEAVSHWKGVSLVDGSPVSGTLRFMMSEVAVPSFSRADAPSGVRWFEGAVPPQGDASLMLYLRFPDGRTAGRVNLGLWMDRNGYGWLDDDLEDVAIVVDLNHINGEISILDWRDAGIDGDVTFGSGTRK